MATMIPFPADTRTFVDCADSIVTALLELGVDERIEAAMPITWRQAVQHLDSNDPAVQVLGYRLLLTALAETPGGPQALIVGLLAALA